jgi:putative hydrolase of the HAD superfamily
MIALVALDADDTLWHNEPLYRDTRTHFHAMLARYHGPEVIDERLNDVERRNLEHFGYGVKGFVLSMIETGLELTENRLEGADVRRILAWGHEMLASPVELLDGVREAVERLAEVFPLILLTKGDLFHQESKLARSGLGQYFKGVEIVSEKDARTYRGIMTRYGVEPGAFVMAGNSLRSDVLPVLEAGGHAVHVPYELTWSHEHVPEAALDGVTFHRVAHIRELPALLQRLSHDGAPGTPVARDPHAEIVEIVNRETRAWDTQDVDLLLTVFHPDMVWPWPPDERAHDPVAWVITQGRFDRDRWRRGWQELFDTHRLVHNRRTIRRVAVSDQGDGAFAVVDVDTLWRGDDGGDFHWRGRACKVYTRLGREWKLIAHTGLLDYGSRSSADAVEPPPAAV